jgi:hypothetical protein
MNFQSLLESDAGLIRLRSWVDPGLDLAHKLLGTPSSLTQADPVNAIDLDPDCADVPTSPTDIPLLCVSLGRLV